MSHLCARPTSAACAHVGARTRAFTLAEVGMVTLIIGLLAALAVPQLKKAVITARSETLINDLRVFQQAFESYLHDKGDWPPEQSEPGQIPPVMINYLHASDWQKQTPIGGYYNWESQQLHNGRRARAAIAISSVGEALVSSDRIQLEDIDRRLDDGDLATGSFRLGYRNEPIFIIEP